jgi:hypothetical protein
LSWSTGARCTLLGGAALAALVAVAPARAEAACGKPEKKKIYDLYTEGIKSYDDLDMEAAKSAFKKAVEAAKKSGCSHKQMAKVHLRLAVIAKVADNDEGLALAEFRKAVEVDPEVELDRDISTPELEAVLKKARGSAGSSASKGDAGDSGDSGDDGDKGDKGDKGDRIDKGDKGDKGTKPAKAIAENDLRCFAVRDGSASMCVDSEVELKVQCESSTDLATATMNYRVDGGPWVPNEMVGAGGFFGTTVSASSIKGKRIEFYVDAFDTKTKRVAYAGTIDGSYSVKIGCKRSPSSSDSGDGASSGSGGDEDRSHKSKKDKGDDAASGLDDEDPLGSGDGDTDDEDKHKDDHKDKDTGPKTPGSRIFSFFFGFGTGGGIATSNVMPGTTPPTANYTQINFARVGRGFMWAPVHIEPEAVIHIPGTPIGVGVFGRIQASPILTWQAGLRGHFFIDTGSPIKLMANVSFAFGARCGTVDAQMGFGCRGGIAYLINTASTNPMNPLDYVLVGPFAAGAGFGAMWEINKFVGIFARLDVLIAFGSTGFSDEMGDPIPFVVQPHFDFTLGMRFGN